jgi:hypothetical protein
MIGLSDNLSRHMFSIKCCGYGFVGPKPIQKRLGLRVVEGVLFGLDLWSLMESAAN